MIVLKISTVRKNDFDAVNHIICLIRIVKIQDWLMQQWIQQSKLFRLCITAIKANKEMKAKVQSNWLFAEWTMKYDKDWIEFLTSHMQRITWWHSNACDLCIIQTRAIKRVHWNSKTIWMQQIPAFSLRMQQFECSIFTKNLWEISPRGFISK